MKNENLPAIRRRGQPGFGRLQPVKPNRSRFLSSPGKLLVALPALIGASQASAAIVYTDFGPSGVSGSDISFNLDGSYSTSSSDGGYAFSLFAKTGLNVPSGYPGYIAQSGETTLFGTNQMIGPFAESGLSFTNTSVRLSPALNTPAYLGLEFDDNNDTPYYGWAEVELNSSSQLTLFGIAYDDTGASILTGDTGAPAIPEPVNTAFLASLAAGAVAALAARRKRKAKASAVIS